MYTLFCTQRGSFACSKANKNVWERSGKTKQHTTAKHTLPQQVRDTTTGNTIWQCYRGKRQFHFSNMPLTILYVSQSVMSVRQQSCPTPRVTSRNEDTSCITDWVPAASSCLLMKNLLSFSMICFEPADGSHHRDQVVLCAGIASLCLCLCVCVGCVWGGRGGGRAGLHACAWVCISEF